MEERQWKVIEGCIRNDRKAQEKLYQQFLGPMLSLCIRYIGNHQEASEVVNDGFLKVFKNISQYTASVSSIYTWMRKIMVNTCIDFIRKKKTLIFVYADNSCEEEGPVTEEIVDNYNAQELLFFISLLPDTTRIVFNLYTIEGFSHKEISTFLFITESTSWWHLTEARKRLKKSLQKHG